MKLVVITAIDISDQLVHIPVIPLGSQRQRLFKRGATSQQPVRENTYDAITVTKLILNVLFTA
jgi:hypothetical protein